MSDVAADPTQAGGEPMHRRLRMLDATDPGAFPGWGAVPPVAGAALIIWSGQRGRHAVMPWLGARPLRFLGLISYSLYLWHWAVLAFARDIAVEPLGAGRTTAAIALASGLAVLSWRFVERPFRRGMSDRTIWLFSAAGMALLLVVAGAIVCDTRACPFISGGHAVFADHGHLTQASARRLAPLFAAASAP